METTTVDMQGDCETIFAYRYRRHTETKALATLTLASRGRRFLNNFWLSVTNVYHPLSRFRQYWERVIKILVLFNSMAIPWQIAFRLNKDCSQSSAEMYDTCVSRNERMIAIAVDAMFWIDILLSFRSGYVDRQMMIHLAPADVVRRYLRVDFWIDLVANFPYYSIATGLAEKGNVEGSIAMNVYILPKLLRTARLFRAPGGGHFASSLTRIVNMVVGFVMASHWCGCIWYFIGRWEAESVGANRYTGNVAWIEVPLNDDGATYLTSDLRTKYTASVYWAVTTMSTVGYGDISPQTNIERIYTMVVMFLGATSTALILGNVAVLIANFNNAAQEFRDKRYELDEYLQARDISADLSKRARKSLLDSWSLQRGIDLDSLLEEIPSNIRTEILLHIHSKQIHSAYLFIDCDDLFMRALISKLKAETFAPGNTIVLEGDIARHLYYIKCGKVKVLREEEGGVYNVLADGDVFGETELFDTTPRVTSTIQALTAVNVQLLAKDTFHTLLNSYPEYRDRIRDLCLQRKRADAYRRQQERSTSNAAADVLESNSDSASIELDTVREGTQADVDRTVSAVLHIRRQLARLQQNLTSIEELYEMAKSIQE